MVTVNKSDLNQDEQPTELGQAPLAASLQGVQTQSATQVTDPAQLSQKHGQLVIIGGAEDKEGECRILREFVRRAGGMDAHIAVMTVATGLPGEVGEQYINVFNRLGVDRVKVIDTARPEDGKDPRALEILQEVTGVFFTGGNQARITELLKGTLLRGGGNCWN
jgi:cyanophycinase